MLQPAEPALAVVPPSVEETEQILFPDGLVGCPSWRRFALLASPAPSPILRLQCLSEPAVCFVVVDPRHLEPDYRVAVSREELLDLGLDDVDEAAIYCTLSVRGEPAVVTANLLAPLVVNPRFRVGKQVVLADSGYSARHPVGATAATRAESKGG